MSTKAGLATLMFGASLLTYPQGPAKSQPEQQISGCPSGNVTAPLRVLKADDFAELERTDCFFGCSAYKVRIYADGRVQWQGNRGVFSRGRATRSVAPEKARTLIEKYRTNSFWGLCANYSGNYTDAPTFHTTVSIGDPAKRVSNYANAAPAWLRDLENEIDALANTYEWIWGNWQSKVFAYLPNPKPGPKPPGVALVEIWEALAGPRPGATPLMLASGWGEVSEVARLLAAKADTNATDLSGWTPLMYAAGGRAPEETIPLLLAAGANPKARSAMGQTALMAVASPSIYTRASELKLLIDAGADVNVSDKNGQTALMFASSRPSRDSAERTRRDEMITLLRSAGAQH